MPRTMTKQPGGREDTCDVSLSELEDVSAPRVPSTPDLPTSADWICVDRMFLSSFAGTCLLMLGSVVMVLVSLQSPEAPNVPPPEKVAIVAPVEPAAVSEPPGTQIPVAKKPAPHAKRKVRKAAAKAPAKAKVAERQVKPRRRSLAMR